MGLLSSTWIGCFLALLPGPERIKIDEARFQLYPIDKTNRHCSEVIPGQDIAFYLYTRKFAEKPAELRIGDDVRFSTSGYDIRFPTVIFFPPFFEDVDGVNVRDVRESYLRTGEYNFISIVAGRLNAGPWYPTAARNSWVVGRYSAVFIDYLITKGVPLSSMHFIGFSIGAHAAGVAGQYLKHGKPPRITGLDPASPLFLKKPLNERLDKSDAVFVDVIHTDRFFGITFPVGHVDFFVNYDVYPQPGCSFTDVLKKGRGLIYKIFCSHLHSNSFYAMTVLHPRIYPAYRCDSTGCDPQSVEFMGANVSTAARGVYYVSTTETNDNIS